MKVTWNYDHPDYNSEEKKLLEYNKSVFQQKLPGTGEAVAKGLSLYRFLMLHKDTPINILHKEITLNGNPMFTKKDLEEIVIAMKEHIDTPYAQYILKQSGGAAFKMPAAPAMPAMPAAPAMPTMPAAPAMPTMPGLPAAPAIPAMPATPALPELPAAPALPAMPATPALPDLPAAPALPAMPAAPALPGLPTMPGLPPAQPFHSTLPVVPTVTPGHGLDHDESRSKFWDKMIRKLIYPVTRYIPACLSPMLSSMFILYNLEQHPQYGVLISTYFDTVTLSMPVVADFIAELVAKLGGTFGGLLPGGGAVANIAAQVIVVLFVVTGVVLNVSRKHFGSAFKLSLEAIPVLGESLSTGAQQIEIGVERYLQNRARILGQIQPTMPKVAAFAEYWTPTPDIVEGPPPPMSVNIIKSEAGDAIEKTTGVDVDTIIEDPIGALNTAAKPIIAPIEAATGINVDKALRNPVGAVTNATSAVSNTAASAVPELPVATNATATNVKNNAKNATKVTENTAIVEASKSTITNKSSNTISKPNNKVSFAPSPVRKRGGKTRRSKRSSQRNTKKYGRH